MSAREQPQAPAQSARTSSSTDQAVDQEDCLGCRITGSLTFIGTGAYLLYEARRHLRSDAGAAVTRPGMSGAHPAASASHSPSMSSIGAREAATRISAASTRLIWRQLGWYGTGCTMIAVGIYRAVM